MSNGEGSAVDDALNMLLHSDRGSDSEPPVSVKRRKATDTPNVVARRPSDVRAEQLGPIGRFYRRLLHFKVPAVSI